MKNNLLIAILTHPINQNQIKIQPKSFGLPDYAFTILSENTKLHIRRIFDIDQLF